MKRQAVGLVNATFVLLFCASWAAHVGHTPEEWKDRVIYQVSFRYVFYFLPQIQLLTDRYSLPPGTKPGLANNFPACLHTYCGGTFQGAYLICF